VAGRIRREDIDAVRERIRIEDVVGEQVTLRPAGGGALKGLCPFHDERSPSFNVRPQVALWHCFGCGEGGDVFAFLQRIDHQSFAEVVERLASQAGVQLRYEDGSSPRQPDVGRRQRLLDAHGAAAEFYAEQLAAAGGEPARRFLSERGFERADAERFGVGYAPLGWNALVGHLRKRGFTDAELVSGGLARQGSRGPYDTFRGRAVWPIRDVTGAVVGFGARRLLEEDTGPKYLNTPDSPIYHKSQVLYGIDLAKREIARRRQVVVVEGYTDVMACHLSGVPTAVATCGTAFGAEHIAVVRRLLGDDGAGAGEVVFAFDADEAGRKAALRAFAEDQRFLAQTYVTVGPDGMDPCDLRQAKGADAVAAMFSEKQPLFEFAIKSTIERFDLETENGRLAALDAAAPIVAGIRDRALRHRYAVGLDRWLGFLDERFVVQRVARAGSRTAASRRPAGPVPPEAAKPLAVPRPDLRDPVVSAERQLLQAVLQYPGQVPKAFDDLGGDAFTAPAHRAVHDAVRVLGGVAAAGPGWAERVRETVPDAVRALAGELAVASLPVPGEDAVPALAAGLVRGVTDRDLLRREAALRGHAQRLEASGDTEGAAAAYRELFEVTARRRSLRED
jgi:DNA primase